MQTQREHARWLTEDKDAFYLLPVLGNQPGTYAALDALDWEDTPVAAACLAGPQAGAEFPGEDAGFLGEFTAGSRLRGSLSPAQMPPPGSYATAWPSWMPGRPGGGTTAAARPRRQPGIPGAGHHRPSPGHPAASWPRGKGGPRWAASDVTGPPSRPPSPASAAPPAPCASSSPNCRSNSTRGEELAAAGNVTLLRPDPGP